MKTTQGVIGVPTTDTMNHKQSGKYAYNQHSGVCNEDTGHNQSQMPNRKGNHSTLSASRVPPVGASAKERGTRSWTPSSGQNYVGNPDKIQERQGYNRVGNKD
ncbi:hypothetical protein UFOVP94_33 [uncultured Caudovirales phage]|uniref:Uncharacterized protein n=1 Tax=uncultured Caudovirales phage TaxID=2100421 RepID=A0A6J5L1X1_9CAUD|nr:hypothetical protein UFOVP94_33 [uncultured Caudovirales phage]CAB5212391.1 hypothetical protein UFOVP186_10 [uncultured Caudovirales phage]